MIARFGNGYDPDLEEDKEGAYVLYEDHLKEMEIMQESIDYWKKSYMRLDLYSE